MEVLAERLKWLREKKRLGQKEVAGNIGITLSGYQKMEYGESNPKLETLIRISKYYQITSDFLLGLNDDTKDLLDLRRQLIESKSKLETFRSLQEDIRNNIFMFDKERIELRQRASVIEKEAALERQALIEHRVADLKERLNFEEARFFESKLTYERILFEYILELFNTPYSKPEEDNLISDYLPLDVVLNEEGENAYSLRLVSKTGHKFSLLAWSQGKDRDGNYKDINKRLMDYKKLFRL